jgi:hypothetical protein
MPRSTGPDFRALAQTLHDRGLVDLNKTVRDTVAAATEGVEAAGMEDSNWYAVVGGSGYGVVIK